MTHTLFRTLYSAPCDFTQKEGMENNTDEIAKEIEVTVLCFAKARELTGNKECKIHISRKLSSTDLLEKIISTFQLEAIRNQLILAINEEFVIPNSILVLSEKDKIAIIPPLSGG